MVNLWHTFETSGFLTDFQSFFRVFRPADNLFRVMVDIVTRVLNDSGATRADLIYQWNRIKNRFKHLWWSFFTKIVNNFSLFPANIHLLSVFHWQFLITCTFSVSLKFRTCLHQGSVRRIHSKECYCRGMETNFEKGTRPEWRRTLIVEDKLITNQLRRRDAALCKRKF